MTLKKFLLLILAMFLLLLINMLVVYGFFHQYVFNFPSDGDVAQLGEEYQGATVLHDKSVNDFERYLLVKMKSGETRLLPLQGCTLHPGRYRYVSDGMQVIPDVRPYTCTARTDNIARLINIQGDWIRPLEGGGPFYCFLETVEQALPCILLVLEVLIWGLAAHLMKKKRQAAT